MRLFPDLRRLRWVHDVCLLPGNAHAPHEATAWYTATFIDPRDVLITSRSVSLTVISNKVLTWTRTYTRDGLPPGAIAHSSWFHLHEWLPWLTPSVEASRGFGQFGMAKHKAIAYLPAADTREDYLSRWSEQARRHLKAFRKAEGAGTITLRKATLQELLPAYTRSQVPFDMQEVFVAETQRHVQAHPETVDIMVAEHSELGIVAGFVGANCEEAKQSIYLLGFFLPEAEKLHPMAGLVDWWFQRCINLGFRACNFGIMVGPNPVPIDQGIGYSNFKTHFGITRIWTPGNYWKISR